MDRFSNHINISLYEKGFLYHNFADQTSALTALYYNLHYHNFQEAKHVLETNVNMILSHNTFDDCSN